MRPSAMLPVPGAKTSIEPAASGRPRTVAEMARALSEAMGAGAPQPVVTGRYRLGDVRHVFASIERARGTLGFEPLEDFAAGMREFATAPLRRGADPDGP